MRDYFGLAYAFHQRTVASSYDTLADAVLELHRPFPDGPMPVCLGCDNIDYALAAWPCRTYVKVACILLRVPSIAGLLMPGPDDHSEEGLLLQLHDLHP